MSAWPKVFCDECEVMASIVVVRTFFTVPPELSFYCEHHRLHRPGGVFRALYTRPEDRRPIPAAGSAPTLTDRIARLEHLVTLLVQSANASTTEERLAAAQQANALLTSAADLKEKK